MKKAVEDFVINESVSDLPLKPKASRDLENELFSDKRITKVLDAYEETIGIKNKLPKKTNIVYKNILLSPGYDEEDKALFNELLNDIDLYRIVKMTDNWTARGDYRVFIVYTEDLDVKQQRAEEKEKNE